MTEQSAPSAEATPAADVPKDITGAEALAMVNAQKEAGAASKGADPVTADTIKEAAEIAKKWKVKVDGREEEVDEKELLRGYGHQKAANKKLQEGLAHRKQAEEFLTMMRDPEKFYDIAKKLGHDPRALAEKYLVGALEDDMMDPRDKELRDTKTKLKAIEDMERRQQEYLEQQRNETLKKKYAQDYESQFISALGETGLPQTKSTVASMAKYVARAATIGFQMTAIEAAKLVQEDIMLAQQRLLADADGETLIKLLGGEGVVNKVRKYDTSRLKNPEQHLKTPPRNDTPRPNAPRNMNKRMSPKEWREFNRLR